MERIPDAPWIVEAERDGYPSSGEDFPIASVICRLESAHYELGQALDALSKVIDLCEGYGIDKDMEKLFERLEDVRTDISLMKMRING